MRSFVYNQGMFRLFAAILVFLVMTPLPVKAGEVRIKPGESVTVGSTTVTCTAGNASAPVELRDCQHWDKFNRTCLYEKTTLVWKNLRCENSCQVWDDFSGACLFEASCRFIPSQEVFVRTTCADFDRFNKICRRKKDELVR